MSLFISFEGGEGAGKTTQAQLLRDRLMEQGHICRLVHEPGGTTLGDRLRPLIKGEVSMSYTTELLLFSAARAELVSTVIKPSLDAGNVVVADRYVDSTTAYQGYGRRLSLEQVQAVNAIATQQIMPDLILFMDVDPEEALKRLSPIEVGLSLDDSPPQIEGRQDDQDQSRFQFRLPLDDSALRDWGRQDYEGQRKFEEEAMEFHMRVRQGYLKLAEEEPDRWVTVDASRSQEEVRETIWQKVRTALVASSA